MYIMSALTFSIQSLNTKESLLSIQCNVWKTKLLARCYRYSIALSLPWTFARISWD